MLNSPKGTKQDSVPTNNTNDVAECILRDYYAETLDIYGLTISLIEKHPEQANNEIRNALTHLARALASKEPATSKVEMDKAKGHFERAQKDCLKLCILELHERMMHSIHIIEYSEGTIRSDIKLRLRKLERDRKDAFVKESRNDDSDTMEAFKKITYDLLDLEDQILQAHPNAGSKGSMVRYWWVWSWIHARKIIYAVSVGIIASAAIGLIVSVM